MAGTTGLEPATSDVTGRRSNQLNYVPAVCHFGYNKNSMLRPSTASSTLKNFCYDQDRCGPSLRASGFTARTAYPCIFLNEVQRTDQSRHRIPFRDPR